MLAEVVRVAQCALNPKPPGRHQQKRGKCLSMPMETANPSLSSGSFIRRLLGSKLLDFRAQGLEPPNASRPNENLRIY